MPAPGDILIEVRMKQGKMEKRCTKCRQFKPLSSFHRRGPKKIERRTKTNINRPRAWCKMCEKSTGPKRWLEKEAVSPFIKECIDRIGLVETARRTGITKGAVHRHRYEENKWIQFQTAEKYMRLLFALRVADERRTRGDIHHNRLLRRQNAMKGCE